VQNWADALADRKRVLDVNRAIALDRDKLRLMEAALETSEEAAKRAKIAFEAANAATSVTARLPENLHKLLHNHLTETVVGRMGETTGQDIAAVSLDLLARSSDVPFVPFETSGIVGQFLTAIQAERRTSREEWSDQRLRLRFVDDASFWDSTVVQWLLPLISASRFEENTVVNFSSEERNIFILGIEALLWRHWFAYSNLLHQLAFQDRDPERVHSVGEVFDGRLVKSQDLGDLNDGTGYGFVISGDFYPGALSLNEALAKVLFNKFARQYFERNPDAVPKPMMALDESNKFNKARYDELWKMPDSIFSSDRAKRLDEVRVLVIVYFICTKRTPESGADGQGANAIRKAIREMLELPSGEEVLEKILEGLPTFPAPGAPAVTQALPTDLSALASALASPDYARSPQNG
jgi:hypothetical protein